MSSRSDPARGTPGSKTSSVPSHCWPAAGRRPGTVPKPLASDPLPGVKQIPFTLCNMLAIKITISLSDSDLGLHVSVKGHRARRTAEGRDYQNLLD